MTMRGKCEMCYRPLYGHPRCAKCEILLERKENRLTRCRCGRYHNSPSEKNPECCRECMGEEPRCGEPKETNLNQK